MKTQFYLIIIGSAILAMHGCGESNAGIEGISNSSCSLRVGHELRSMNLDFQGADITRLLNLTGFYGIEGIDDNSCGPYGEDSLTGKSNLLEFEKVKTNRLAVYSSQTYIVFDGVFLPKQWTLQLWLNPLLNKQSGIIMEENMGNKKALFLSLNVDKKLSLNLPPSDNSVNTTHLTIKSSDTLTANAWQHIAIVVSGNDVLFYINGVLDSKQNFDSSTYNSLKARSSFSSEVKKVCFGSCRLSEGDISLQGKADNIEFVHRTLSSDEILRNYQASNSTFQ